MSIKSTIWVSRTTAIDMLIASLKGKLERLNTMSNKDLGDEMDLQLDESRPFDNWLVTETEEEATIHNRF